VSVSFVNFVINGLSLKTYDKKKFVRIVWGIIMPHKTCTKCNKQCGVRTKVCECGNEFIKKDKQQPAKKDKPTRTMAEVSVGAWINDMPKGMPKVTMPTGLENEAKMLDIKTIKHYVEYEGLGFCISDYIPPNRISDTILRQLWKDAKKQLIDIKKYLES
jgi:hypothetical protein